MNSPHNRFHSLAVALLLLGVDVAYADTAGYVQFVNGEVQLTTADGKTHRVRKGDAVNEGDTLASAKAASAQIKMQDGGFVAVRSDTQLKFDSFRFSGKEDGSEQSFFSLFKGGFRAVTGLIGRINKPSYRITTPTSTIGIRGTDHETFVVALGSEMAAVASVGAYNKVNIGETYMATDKGTIFVMPNQMGFAGAKDQMPQLQPINTNIFTVAAAPMPQAEGDKKEDKKEETKDVRETAVGDSAAQEQAAAPAPAPVAPVEAVATEFIQLPITLADGTNLTGGGTPLPPPPPPVVTHNPAYAGLNGYGYEVLGVNPATGSWVNPFATNLPGTSYLLDAGNNLVEVVGQVNFSGGAAQDTFVAADGSVYFGRWQGGTYTDQFTLVPVALGNTSMQWVFAANPPVGYVQTLAGTTNYTLTAATHPTDKFGNVGTLTAATLTADFTNQIVNTSLTLSFSTTDPINISAQDKAFTVTTPNGIPIFSDNIWGGGAAACTGTCDPAGYTVDIWARFAANAADKVAIPYNIIGNSTDLVQGVAMVTASTLPTVATTPFVQTDLAVAFATLDFGGNSVYNQFANNTFIAAPADINNTLPTPFLIDRYAGQDSGSSITHTFSGTTTVGEATTTIAATGIQFGRYNSTQGQMVVVGTTYTKLAPGTYLSGGAVYSHWITGPAVAPVYLPEVLLTTATYNFAGGTVPTTLSGAASSLNSGSLMVNFTQRLVNFDIALTVGADTWMASTSGAPLEMMYWNNAQVGFRAQTPLPSPIPSGVGALVISCPSCSVTATGTAMGQLTGNGLTGAILSYSLSNGLVGTGGEIVTGVAAFTGVAQDTTTPYRIAALSTVDPAPPANAFPAGVTPIPLTVVIGGNNNTASVLADASGNLTQFNGTRPFTAGSSTVTVDKGTAVAAGLGTDPVSGISWGRWAGGALNITNVATGAVSTLSNPSSSHWVTGPVMTGPVALPVSGTYNYVLAGGTAPTDSLGGVGTLNSATLSANFTAQTVAVGIDVTTPNAGNLVATGAAIPIEQKSFFSASTANMVGYSGSNNPGLLTVTCPAGCGAAGVTGHVSGAFTGTGGIGAGVIYGMDKGGVLVNGAAAFHR